MPNAYCYHRFSSSRQDKGMSLERQAERTVALCEAKGWTIVDKLEDKGRSAWKGDHLRVGKLGQFKARVDSGEIEPGTYLVIENLDRLSRQDVKFARRWIEDITDRGIIVAVCTPEIIIDADALSGSNIVSMIQYLLEAKRSTGESARKSEMQTAAVGRFMDKARKGVVYTARCPAWLRGVKDNKFELIEERVAVVNQIYEWSASGMGVWSIARRLNDTLEPWNPSVKRENKWKPGYVRDILTTPSVEGEYHVKSGTDRKPTGEIIEGYYPRVVPAELVERARAAIKLRAGSGGAGRREACNLFAGRTRCGHCGDMMIRTVHRRKGTAYEYLKCVRFNAAGNPKADDDEATRKRKCQNGVVYRYDLFEKAALAQILHLALDNSFFVKTDDISPLAGRLADTNKEVERLKAQQTRLLTFIMENDDADEAKAMLDTLRPKLETARSDQQKAQDALDKAKGQVSPDEHLRRVLEVKEAIYSDDADEREEARRKVRDAIQSVVSVVECKHYEPDANARPYRATPRREITMALAGGYMAFRFDGEGKLTGKISLQGIPDMERGAISVSDAATVESVRQRRRKAA